MPVLQCRNIHFGFGSAQLLDGVSLKVKDNERICLVGRNGSGKSTLLKILQGQIIPDDGVIQPRQGARITMLDQQIAAYEDQCVFDVVAGGLADAGKLLQRYHHLSQTMTSTPDQKQMAELERVQQQLEAVNGWDLQAETDNVLSRLKLNAETLFSSMSGGQKRRTLLARALVNKPDLLLLDEPTNHLDIESIEWLEKFLLSYRGTLLFITHDRSFLQRLATSIIDLDRGKLTRWDCDYATYLKRKQALLDEQEQQASLFDKKLSQEETWIRQGIKARRTRNEGRVRALKKMREEHRQRRNKTGDAKFQTSAHNASGKRVIEADNISYSIAGHTLIRQFSTSILRGDKIGLLGPNGCGKSTLLRLLLGEIEPETGSIQHGTNLAIAYFDQLRSQLDPEKTIIDNLADGRDTISINGQERHVISYLQDFLFSPERTRTPVSALSGGECNRLLLAKLFSKPANLLVLDEPTNDLDIETLELLESLLVDFSGTLLLVSHDREFLDNVVTDTLAFEGDGLINSYVGGYQDWIRQRQTTATVEKKTTSLPATIVTKTIQSPKMSYKDQRELELLPGKIEKLETNISDIHLKLADPELYQNKPEEITSLKRLLEENEASLENCFQRWEELENPHP